MIVLFYQSYPSDEGYIVLWDGLNTYWREEMKPSPDYTDINRFNDPCPLTGSLFTIIGVL